MTENQPSPKKYSPFDRDPTFSGVTDAARKYKATDRIEQLARPKKLVNQYKFGRSTHGLVVNDSLADLEKRNIPGT
ncbi:hypothetical protein SNEBB_000355 [Seison nebaliae]|nr:hypothetical protein SNEBB_000355 [Seison nebaliae]